MNDKEIINRIEIIQQDQERIIAEIVNADEHTDIHNLNNDLLKNHGRMSELLEMLINES